MTAKRAKPGLGLALLAFVAYVSLGLPDGLLGVAWPSIRREFSLPLDSLGALFVTTTIGYLSSSFFAGRLTARFRLGSILAGSTFLAGAALVAYALAPSWWMLVAVGIAAGLGAGGIDAALNIYVAANHGESMMQWLHASYGVGAMIGPVIMTLAIGSLGTWRWGYALVGGVQVALAAGFVLTMSMWDGETRRERGEKGEAREDRGPRRHQDVPMMQTLREWRVWLSMLLFFVYMGIEVTLGSWAYILLTESRQVSPGPAGFFMAGYWAIFTVGRVAAGFYAWRLGQRVLVVGGLMVALVGAGILTLGLPGPLNLAACGLIGLAIAPILAALLSGTAGRVGPLYAPNTIGIQIAAMGVGAAAVPSFTGLVAERLSLDAIPPFLIGSMILMIGAYLFSLKTGRGSQENGH